MLTSAVLQEIHRRCHLSQQQLLKHCRQFTTDEINREHEGFGYPSMRIQYHHTIGAQRYWVGVILNDFRVDDDDHLFPTIESLEGMRQDVFTFTENYLQSTSDQDLNTIRPMKIWTGDTRELIPAQIIMRTQTHIFHHNGQIAAMCRLLGKPIPPGMDYSLVEA